AGFRSGPLGTAFPSNGGVLVSDGSGEVRRFPSDTDGQSATQFPPAQNYGGGNSADGLVQFDGRIYITQFTQGRVLQLNNDGNLNGLTARGRGGAVGIVANPATGHLFVVSQASNRIVDVDPVTHVIHPFVTSSGLLDGLTLAVDGRTLYVAQNRAGHIVG